MLDEIQVGLMRKNVKVMLALPFEILMLKYFHQDTKP